MFKKTRRDLTLSFTAVMAIFFLLLVFSAHVSMEWSVTSEQEREVLLFAEEEAYEHSILFQHPDIFEKQSDYKSGSGRMYFYAFDQSGRLVNSARPPEEAEPYILNKIREWDADAGVVAVLDIAGDYKLMMSSMPIVSGDKQLGTVYVGRDVTAIYSGMRKSAIILGAYSIVSLLLAAIVGYIMAGKAIVPLKTAYEKQRQFAADASHELRTPLSVIMSSVDVLQNNQKGASPFIRQVVDDMKDEIKKMTNLVGNLLAIARGDEQNAIIRKETFNLNAVVDQSIRKMRPLAEKKNIQLFFANRQTVMVNADLERIAQLILILLDNAIKYTPECGAVTVGAAYGRAADSVCVSVKDTGIGISAADQKLIFDRFYRADQSRSRQTGGGSGLGLAIAKDIVDLHHGSIKVDSTIGNGAAFIVEIPV